MKENCSCYKKSENIQWYQAWVAVRGYPLITEISHRGFLKLVCVLLTLQIVLDVTNEQFISYTSTFFDRLVVQRIDLVQEDHEKRRRVKIFGTTVDVNDLMTSSRRNNIMAAPNIVEHVRHATGTRSSVYTARNRLRAARLRSRHPYRGFQLTGRHCSARMNWARQHSRWTRQQRNRVVFTDESKFNLHGPDCRVRVWRRRGSD